MNQLFHLSKENISDPSLSDLYFVIGDMHCCFGIIEHSSRQLQQLSYYLLDGRNEVSLYDLYEKHPILNERFNETIVSYQYAQSVLSPAHISTYESAGEILEALYGPLFNNVLVSENVSEWQITNSYSIPDKIHKLLCGKYDNGKFWHEHSIALKTILSEADHHDALIIDFMPDQFTIYVVKNTQFHLAQKFAYKNAEDLIYQLVNICQQFDLDRQTLHLLISGLIEQDSSIFSSMYNYFVNIGFRKSASEINMDETLNIHPSHFFVSLFNLAKCA